MQPVLVALHLFEQSLRNAGKQSKCTMICHRPFLVTVSNALVRSTKVMYAFLCFAHDIFLDVGSMKIILVMLWLALQLR